MTLSKFLAGPRSHPILVICGQQISASKEIRQRTTFEQLRYPWRINLKRISSRAATHTASRLPRASQRSTPESPHPPPLAASLSPLPITKMTRSPLQRSRIRMIPTAPCTRLIRRPVSKVGEIQICRTVAWFCKKEWSIRRFSRPGEGMVR